MKPWVDLSSNNGAIDLGKLAPQVDGVILKVSEGLGYEWEGWGERYQLARGYFPLVGLYHFARPSGASGKAEAEYFLSCLGKAGGIRTGTFLCLDTEDDRVANDADLLAHHLEFCGTIERALGIPVWIYSAHYYLEEHNLEGHPELGKRPLWLASWQDTEPPCPAGWDRIWLWQKDVHGELAGVEGEVDLSELLVTMDELRGTCWGFQVDPVAGKPAVGTVDVAEGADVPTILARVVELLKRSPPEVETAIADVELARTRFGLVGA